MHDQPPPAPGHYASCNCRLVKIISRSVCSVNQCPTTFHFFSGCASLMSKCQISSAVTLKSSIKAMFLPTQARGPVPNYMLSIKTARERFRGTTHTAIMQRFISANRWGGASIQRSGRYMSASCPKTCLFR